MSRWLANAVARRRAGVTIGNRGLTAVRISKCSSGWTKEEVRTFPFESPVFADAGALINPVDLSHAWHRLLQFFGPLGWAVVLPDPSARLIRLTLEGAKLRESDIRKLVEHHAVKKGFRSGNIRASWRKPFGAKRSEIVAAAAEAGLCALLEETAKENGSFVGQIIPLFMQDTARDAVQLYATDSFWTLRIFDSGNLTNVRSGWIDGSDWHEHAAEESHRYIQIAAASNPQVLANLQIHCTEATVRSKLEQDLMARGLNVMRETGEKYSSEDAAYCAACSL